MIKRRAIELWLLDHCPSGKNEQFWYQAAEEVQDSAPYCELCEQVAYESWEHRGCPFGDSNNDWDEAKKVLSASVLNPHP